MNLAHLRRELPLSASRREYCEDYEDFMAQKNPSLIIFWKMKLGFVSLAILLLKKLLLCFAIFTYLLYLSSIIIACKIITRKSRARFSFSSKNLDCFF